MILNKKPELYKGYQGVIDAALDVARHHDLGAQEPQAGLVLSLGVVDIAHIEASAPKNDSPAPKGPRLDS